MIAFNTCDANVPVLIGLIEFLKSQVVNIEREWVDLKKRPQLEVEGLGLQKLTHVLIKYGDELLYYLPGASSWDHVEDIFQNVEWEEFELMWWHTLAIFAIHEARDCKSVEGVVEDLVCLLTHLLFSSEASQLNQIDEVLLEAGRGWLHECFRGENILDGQVILDQLQNSQSLLDSQQIGISDQVREADYSFSELMVVRWHLSVDDLENRDAELVNRVWLWVLFWTQIE